MCLNYQISMSDMSKIARNLTQIQNPKCQKPTICKEEIKKFPPKTHKNAQSNISMLHLGVLILTRLPLWIDCTSHNISGYHAVMHVFFFLVGGGGGDCSAKKTGLPDADTSVNKVLYAQKCGICSDLISS